MKKFLIFLLMIFMWKIAFSYPLIPTDMLATEVTQIENNIELITEVGQLADQLATLNNQFQDMLKNSDVLRSFSSTNIQSDLNQLVDISDKTEAISFREVDIDSKFKQKYPGYQDLGQVKNFSDAYQEWSASSMDGLKNLIKTTKQQSDDFGEEETNITNLENSTYSITGRMQAAQLGNEISMEQIKQVQKLRELLMSQSQAQYSYLASERSEKDISTAQVESMLKAHTRLTPNYQHFQE